MLSHRANSKKTPIAKSFITLANTLCTISEQRCYDKDAQRRALAAIDTCRKFRFAELAFKERAVKRRESKCLNGLQTDMVSRLPTEIYAMIIKYLVNDNNGKSPEEMKLRARTLTSLASTCRIFQILCEKYLYTNLRSQRLSESVQSQWLLYFALAVEPRRAHTIRSLRCESWPPCFQYEAWLETLRLCTNLTHLELVWTYSTPKNIVERLGNMVADCPKVSEFSYGGLWTWNLFHESRATTVEKTAKFSHRYTKFAKQLCHLDISGSINCITEILHFDYPDLKSLTVDIVDCVKGDEFFQDLSSHTPSLERLELHWVEELSLNDLRMGFKAWGKTLRSLAINHPIIRYLSDGILAHILPHLPRLEEPCLGPQPRFCLLDLHAIAQPDAPRLKAFRWRVDEAMFHDPLANSETVNQAIIDIFITHSETLNTFIIDQEFDFWNFGTDIFKHLQKAKNLENLRVPLHDIPTKEEIQGLITACPKLGKPDTRLVVVREFLTECTLTTINYEEDNVEVVETSWGSVRHPMRWS
ncbi:uncharacterized protein FSUBG_7883 [Fusarium subglutinans]|uniref:F-box domain-containing protein n=1 Tax=Gibberella subglutinans TaxID=42677 RepID=A0A8H5UXW0_GIBSU|nr:uncharacterized protein FSUBG_7883 [Fusarium subglutinans]KAF5602208.1 hypothetical protein FSUBG_7883 [Fusarium subglutinans]